MGQGPKYDKAFKEQTVQQILSKEATITEMAQVLDVHYTTVRDWVRTYKRDGNNSFPGSGNVKPEDEELRRLRRELAE